MTTELLSISPESLQKAAGLLKAGDVVAFPTETVYGLGASAFSEEGVQKIFQAKGRPSDNPLIVHVAPGADLSLITREVPDMAKRLMDWFWPGPLTLILPKGEAVPYSVTAGLETVAVRMPSHSGAIALLTTAGIPIAAPSANASGRPSPTTAQHVYEDMQGKIPLILDDGSCQVGLESTILDLTGDIPMVLRPGGITMEMLQEVIPEVTIDPAVKQGKTLTADVKPKAPGMKYRHYAPKGRLIVTDWGAGDIVSWMTEDAKGQEKPPVLGVIGSEEWLEAIRAASRQAVEEGNIVVPYDTISLGSRHDLKAVAAHLFDALREADERGWTVMYGEAFPTQDVGEAIMNRFLKASSEQRIRSF